MSVGTAGTLLSVPRESAEGRPVEPPAPSWENTKAPDARATLSNSAIPPAERRIFLRNPNALFGIAFLSVVILALRLAPALFPRDPLSMVGRPFLWPG